MRQRKEAYFLVIEEKLKSLTVNPDSLWQHVCDYAWLRQQPDHLTNRTSYAVNPAVSRLLPSSDGEVLGLRWIIDAKDYDTEATVRRNPRGISAEPWPQEQPCNQTPPQHLWQGYPVDQWASDCVCVCVCLQGTQCNSFCEPGSWHQQVWQVTRSNHHWPALILSLWLVMVLITFEPAENAVWWWAVRHRDAGKGDQKIREEWAIASGYWRDTLHIVYACLCVLFHVCVRVLPTHCSFLLWSELSWWNEWT